MTPLDQTGPFSVFDTVDANLLVEEALSNDKAIAFRTGKNDPLCCCIDGQAGNSIVCAFLGESSPETVRFFFFDEMVQNSCRCTSLTNVASSTDNSSIPFALYGVVEGWMESQAVWAVSWARFRSISGPFLIFRTRLIVVFPFISTGSDDNLLLSTVTLFFEA
jgi:hypothetical protein